MTILEFSKEFPDNASCKVHFKMQREKQGLRVKNVVVQNIIGWKQNHNGNAPHAALERHFEVEQ